MGYPKFIVNTKTLKNNINTIKDLCSRNGIELCAVTKVFHSNKDIVKIYYNEGIRYFASSRITELKDIKENFKDVKTLLIRIPMMSEVDLVVKYADEVLVSDLDVVKELDKVALKYKKKQNVILMQDLGDLREGIIDQNEFIDTACYIEKELSNIHLLGVGTNLTCYGSIKPTAYNLGLLVSTKKLVEERIKRNLEVVSGGATTSLGLLVDGTMPEEVNQLRIGELFTRPYCYTEIIDWKKHFPVLDSAFSIEAEIVEISDKPTYPIGEMATDAFGHEPLYIDKGVRKRAIVALGKCDVGGSLDIYPTDSDAYVLGGSSDHTIIDINDSNVDYKVGDIMSFDLSYEAMLVASCSRYLEMVIR